MEIRCYRRILRISYKDHVTNGEVCDKIQQAIGPHEDLLTIVKRRNLRWYSHVSRSPGLAKTILQGTAKGGRRRGRQGKRWEDNIREWTGLAFSKSQRAVENRGKWKKLVAKSSVVPQRPSRLRDRWWWLYCILLYCIVMTDTNLETKLWGLVDELWMMSDFLTATGLRLFVLLYASSAKELVS